MRLRTRYAAGLVAGGLVWLAGCAGRAVVERPSTTIAGSKFRVIATIAGGSSRQEVRMSATVRKQLTDAGWKGVARSGRWDTPALATTEVCDATDADAVDGVLFVSYDRLELRDCATRKVAYAIDGSPAKGVGIDEMAKRLMRYLRGEPTTPPRH
jgi:hypothetical protein